MRATSDGTQIERRAYIMPNPFDDTDAQFLVLLNEAGQYSLWPRFVPVPMGWQTVFGPSERQKCLDHVNENWVEMRPARMPELDAH